MAYFYTWLLVAIVLFGAVSYMIGQEFALKKDDNYESVTAFLLGFAASLSWPILLVIGVILGPFVWLYRLGAHHKKQEQHKKDTWETLKR